jgi:hypothetical protein
MEVSELFFLGKIANYLAGQKRLKIVGAFWKQAA